MINQYYVYILTNKNNRVLYTGVTNNLERRIFEHKHKLVPGFTKKYNVEKLVWYSTLSDIRLAIAEEKRIKAGPRAKKIELVEDMNPNWSDLSEGWASMGNG
ncbi:MAG: GIY-YIG nuclease family protein [Nitrospinae bacterium]|nr:GIY-YIG nuclease family protein [Nitrospinota bacterium]